MKSHTASAVSSFTFSFYSKQKSLTTKIIFQRISYGLRDSKHHQNYFDFGTFKKLLTPFYHVYVNISLAKNHLPKNKCKFNVDDLWNRQKCIAKIFNRSPDLESVDELALKIEPLMYYTGEGAGNDMRECPDGNRNANISWAKKYKMEWTDVSLREEWRAPNRRMEQ